MHKLPWKRALALLLCALIGIAGAAGAEGALPGSAENLPPPESDWTDRSPLMIAHAMGGIDGNRYTNSRDAFLENYARGFRYFEVDFSFTSDYGLVLWHGWNGDPINSQTEVGYVPTYREFQSMRIDDRYQTLTIEDLIQLMQEYPDIYVITDTKSGQALKALVQFLLITKTAIRLDAEDALDRMIVQIYSPVMYEAVERVHHFKRYIFTLYRILHEAPTLEQLETVADFCAGHDIDLIVMRFGWWSERFLPILEKYDVDVALHTVNSAEDAQAYLAQGVCGLYTDFLPPDI